MLFQCCCCTICFDIASELYLKICSWKQNEVYRIWLQSISFWEGGLIFSAWNLLCFIIFDNIWKTEHNCHCHKDVKVCSSPKIMLFLLSSSKKYFVCCHFYPQKSNPQILMRLVLMILLHVRPKCYVTYKECSTVKQIWEGQSLCNFLTDRKEQNSSKSQFFCGQTQHKQMERLHIAAASPHSINIADFTVSVKNLYGIIKLQSREVDSFMRHTVIVLTYSCYWWNRGNKVKTLLFLCPHFKYYLNAANLVTIMRLFLHVTWLYCWKYLFGKQTFVEQLSGRLSSLSLRHLMLASVRNIIQEVDQKFKLHCKPCSNLMLFQARKTTLNFLFFNFSKLVLHKVKIKQIKSIIYTSVFKKH